MLRWTLSAPPSPVTHKTRGVPTGMRLRIEDTRRTLILLGALAAAGAVALGTSGCSAGSLECGVGDASPGGEPAWSPDGRKVAFRRGTDIYLINVDGSGLRRLARGSCLGYGYPSWSPDGRRIVVMDDDSESAQLAIIDVRTGRRVATVREAGFAPSWSPDGRWIATGDEKGVAIARTTGSQTRKVTEASGYSPRWSPNGNRIVFDGFGGNVGIYVVALSDPRPRKLVNRGESPTWSATGDRIAFLDDGEIDLIRTDGSPLPAAYACGECDISDPDWSPDGTQIVFYEDGVGIRIATVGSDRVRTLVKV